MQHLREPLKPGIPVINKCILQTMWMDCTYFSVSLITLTPKVWWTGVHSWWTSWSMSLDLFKQAHLHKWCEELPVLSNYSSWEGSVQRMRNSVSKFVNGNQVGESKCLAKFVTVRLCISKPWPSLFIWWEPTLQCWNERIPAIVKCWRGSISMIYEMSRETQKWSKSHGWMWLRYT